MDEVNLEQLFEMFDAALTSKDERVQNALRSLLMIVALTTPTTNEKKSQMEVGVGPLIKLMRDLDSMQRRISSLEREARSYTEPFSKISEKYDVSFKSDIYDMLKLAEFNPYESKKHIKP